MSQILPVLLPLMVLATTLVVLFVYWIRWEQKKTRMELLLRDKATLLPNKLQAYERMALFLERIDPNSLVIREQNHQLTALQFHSVLLKAVRKEFEHNLAMQIYLLPETWRLVTRAKEEVLKHINLAARTTAPELPALELGKNLLENAGNECAYSLRMALDALRKDIQLLG